MSAVILVLSFVAGAAAGVLGALAVLRHDREMEVGTVTEDDVVRAVALHLREEGWTVDQELTTFDRGVDVVAKRDGVTLHVEAKGRTSSKVGTARYGRPFSRGQVRDHVAKAILTALEVASRARPSRPSPSRTTRPIASSSIGSLPRFATVEVRTFYVSEDGVVS